jgi:L-fuculose-phosphate aldolase
MDNSGIAAFRATAAQRSLTKAESRLAVNLAFASSMLSNDGPDDLNQGQVSARLPGSCEFLIKGALVGFNEARPDDMILASVAAHAAVPALAPPELPLHQAIYESRPDVSAIVHSHAPYTLIFGATDWEIKPISHDGACFEGGIPRFTGTSNTVLEIETGRAIARVLGHAPAVLLRNHGSVVVGKSIREAAVLAQVLERACRLQVIAEGTGAKYHTSTPEDVTKKHNYIYSDTSVKAYWEYCVRRVKQVWKDTEAW